MANEPVQAIPPLPDGDIPPPPGSNIDADAQFDDSASVDAMMRHDDAPPVSDPDTGDDAGSDLTPDASQAQQAQPRVEKQPDAQPAPISSEWRAFIDWATRSGLTPGNFAWFREEHMRAEQQARSSRNGGPAADNNGARKAPRHANSADTMLSKIAKDDVVTGEQVHELVAALRTDMQTTRELESAEQSHSRLAQHYSLDPREQFMMRAAVDQFVDDNPGWTLDQVYAHFVEPIRKAPAKVETNNGSGAPNPIDETRRKLRTAAAAAGAPPVSGGGRRNTGPAPAFPDDADINHPEFNQLFAGIAE